MEWSQTILIGLFIFLLGLFIKHYLPSYMEEKGKNLATKEDVAEITRKTEEVQAEFREGFEMFASDVHFKYDFYYKQYSELYCNLYAIVTQSEYVRYFVLLDCNDEEKRNFSYENAPFIEVSPRHKATTSINIEEGKPVKYSKKTEDIITPVSQFNKKQLCDYIIENGALASQKLLKLAVSYRFAYEHYSGNPEVKNSSCAETANDEELRLIREMTMCIVSEYNTLRKELKMDYDKDELATGRLII
jgi:hypothetical protein